MRFVAMLCEVACRISKGTSFHILVHTFTRSVLDPNGTAISPLVFEHNNGWGVFCILAKMFDDEYPEMLRDFQTSVNLSAIHSLLTDGKFLSDIIFSMLTLSDSFFLASILIFSFSIF